MRKTKVKLLLLTAIFSLLFACNNHENETEKNTSNYDNIIHQDTLVNIIVDIHKIDGLVLSRSVDSDKYPRETLYFSVFENYNVTNEEFNNTIRYYTVNDIKTLNDIYSEVLGKLNKEKAELTEKLKD